MKEGERRMRYEREEEGMRRIRYEKREREFESWDYDWDRCFIDR